MEPGTSTATTQATALRVRGPRQDPQHPKQHARGGLRRLTHEKIPVSAPSSTAFPPAIPIITTILAPASPFCFSSPLLSAGVIFSSLHLGGLIL